MPPPPTHRAFRRRPGKQAGGIEMSSGTTTKPGPLAATEVLLKIHAVSINYRDVAMLHGKYPVEVLNQGIATSDCAAEVVELGSKVVDFAVGDHVSVIFNLAVIKGDEDTPSRALGGDSEGVLREYAVFDQEYLVHLPKSLRWDEVCMKFPTLAMYAIGSPVGLQVLLVKLTFPVFRANKRHLPSPARESQHGQP